MNLVYASFWRRFMAFFLDIILVGFISLPASLLFKIINMDSFVINNLFSLFLNIAYFVFYQARFGQTIGKKILGIKIVNQEGQTPSVFIFFLREIIGKTASALMLGIGYLWMLWDGKKQSIHDKIASTFVVRVLENQNPASVVPTAGTPTATGVPTVTNQSIPVA